MSNQLYLSLLFWIVDYYKIIMYSDKFFVIPDKSFHVYHTLYWSWETFFLAVIKDSAEYW